MITHKISNKEICRNLKRKKKIILYCVSMQKFQTYICA